MRRTASEIIRNLESRIARLERQSASRMKTPRVQFWIEYDPTDEDLLSDNEIEFLFKKAVAKLEGMFGVDIKERFNIKEINDEIPQSCTIRMKSNQTFDEFLEDVSRIVSVVKTNTKWVDSKLGNVFDFNDDTLDAYFQGVSLRLYPTGDPVTSDEHLVLGGRGEKNLRKYLVNQGVL